ncbi:MAG: c-type cytochrome [Gammaproteobacteria bacterium]|nr:c-type cytochrome [Gammaproteobacteria bacterium]MDP2139757.1 c-type cytochrome [Gammaproteobacteria bacterium]MDP2348959.1 c-type cytochrome [Gammaproteobacteria bacterium]
MSVFSSSIRRIARFSMLALGVVFAGSIAAQSSDQLVAERMKPIGEVCLAGQACAGGAAPMVLAQAATAEFSAAAQYTQSCAMCHTPGVAGAPRLDNAAEWAARVAAKGRDTIVQNAITGINAMPPRGMCMTCTDENMAALVDYMLSQGQ